MLPLQFEDKFKPTTVEIPHRDCTSMQSHGILHYGEAKPRTAQLAAPPLIYAIETLEKTRQMLFGHTGTIIGEAEIIKLFVTPETGYCNYRTLSGIGDGIIGQIGFAISIPVLLYMFVIHAFSGTRPVKMRSICVD